MIWKTTNGLGEEVTWFSKDEVKNILKEILEIHEHCIFENNAINNCSMSCKYYNDCDGEFSYLGNLVNKKIEELEQ